MINETEEKELLFALQGEEGIENCLLKENSWPVLCHLSNIRENLLEWYDFNPHASLLEIGAECGALTGLFCRRVSRVVAIELSERDSRINQIKNKQYDNLSILCGDFCELEINETFDYVMLIGGFGMIGSSINDETPYLNMLKKAGECLKPGGKLFLAIENKYGVKYFAGAPEDHTGRCFDGLENYAGVLHVRTFSHKRLNKMLLEAGFSKNEFYYPMPEYKFPSEIYSDQCLPSFGALRYPCVSYDKDRYELLDERLVFDSVCSDGMFDEFANSFLVISDNGNEKSGQQKDGQTVIYAKYNRERAPEFQISTKIIAGEHADRCVEKTALRREARAHVEKLSENRKKLTAANAMLKSADQRASVPVPAEIICCENGKAVFPYIEGQSLAKEVHAALGCKEEFLRAMHYAVDSIFGGYLNSPEYLVDFKITEEFERIFGTFSGQEYEEIFKSMKSLAVSNIDSILSNFVRTPEDGLVCLDYEWVFDFPVPVEYLIYRTVYYYYSENIHYIKISEKELWSDFGFAEKKIRLFCQMDDYFQQYVHGKDRRYMYLANYAKKTFNIGKDIQKGEEWFLSIINDIHCLNAILTEDIRDLVECHVETRRKGAYLDMCKKMAAFQKKIVQKMRKILRIKAGR